MRQVCPFICVLLICAALPQAHTQTAPSPRFMVESWRAWSGAFAHKVHSYRLQGRETIIRSGVKVAGRSMAGQTWSWQTVRQNALYRYERIEPRDYSALSYDGTRWYFVVQTRGQSPQHSVLTKDPAGDGYTTTFQQEHTQPQTIEAFMNCPGMYPSAIPLPDQFLAQPRKIQLVGTDTIAGRLCYHLHFGDQSNPRLPADVWLTQVGQYFVPWQSQTSPGHDPVRGMIIVQAGAEFDGIWYPTACNYRVDSGNARRGWKSYDETTKTFPISDINKVFPVADFQLKPLKNSDMFVDDKVVEPPTPKRATPARIAKDAKNRRNMLRHGLLAMFVVCSGILLLTLFKRRPQGK